jgi:glycerol uptake facilitator protein
MADQPRKTPLIVGECISEVIGTAILIMVGDSAAAMYFMYDPSPYKTAYWGVCIAWGLGVAIAVYTCGGVSGAHINPAVTLPLAIFRKFPKWKIIPYVISQVIGAIIGAAIVYAMFYPVIDQYNALHNLTRAGGDGMPSAGVFFTHPNVGITPLHAFMDQIFLTGLLLLGIMAIIDQYNENAPRANAALIIGLLVAMIGASAGYLEAWAINPARDFGPRVFAYFAGWGPQAFPSPGNFWWVPIAGPLIGGVLGASIYEFMIRPWLPQYRQSKLREVAGKPVIEHENN